jgi:serine/threonine protein kinase HipA of HipAB toxin-antitoxin module
MSKLGIRWEIDGIPAAFVTRGSDNGCYRVTFERSEANLEQIEQINWSNPAVKRVTESSGELGLPFGYGFDLMDLRYQHSNQLFVAELKVAQQYMGDVSDYQVQIQQLTETINQQMVTANQQAAQMANMVADMEAAYERGVESHG